MDKLEKELEARRRQYMTEMEDIDRRREEKKYELKILCYVVNQIVHFSDCLHQGSNSFSCILIFFGLSSILLVIFANILNRRPSMFCSGLFWSDTE